LEKQALSKHLPNPLGHELPLNLEKTANYTASSKNSFNWIEQHGLNAKKLNLYQILAPNAYSYIEDYIPVLNKTVQSQVHEVNFI
jgi:von Willebrand factor A domain-containing protein 3